MAAAVEDADVVHSHTWYANFAGHLAAAPLRPPARRDGAQPRAAAPVEGGAARRRLRALELLRAHGARGGRRDHRRVGRAAARHRSRLPEHRPRADRGDPQRDRRRRVPARPRHRRARALRRRPGRAVASSSSGASRGRRACRYLLEARARHRSGGAARPLRGRAGHAGARAPRWRNGRRAARPRAAT